MGSALTPDWLAEARAIVGVEHLATDPETLEAYGRDWTRVHAPRPSAVVFVHTTEQVSRLLTLAQQRQVAIVPSGGRTGLAGGAVAARGELVLSFERMRHMHEVDPVARTVRVQAGAVTKAVHDHVAPHGLTWPVDFASSGSSQVGGNIATNAGGVRVVRYGLTRQWVIGLQVVLMGGQVLELNGALEKNNTGIDLRQVFIGSEGILGVVTEATLKLTRRPREGRVVFLGVSDLEAALVVFASARRTPGLELLAFEYLTDLCLDAVLEETKAPAPLSERSPAYVLVELESSDDAEVETQWLEALLTEGLIQDGVVAESAHQSQALWALRERISETLSKRGFVHKNDVSVPVSSLTAFTRDMRAAFLQHYPDFPIYFFGHVGDGNLHVNVMKPESLDRESFMERCKGTDALLFDLIRRHGGSISAEHGIGLLKKRFLPYSRTPEELRLFRALKRVFDPLGLLNPGKVFDLEEGAES